MLRGYGVDYAQGFEVGRPASAIPLGAADARAVAAASPL